MVTFIVTFQFLFHFLLVFKVGLIKQCQILDTSLGPAGALSAASSRPTPSTAADPWQTIPVLSMSPTKSRLAGEWDRRRSPAQHACPFPTHFCPRETATQIFFSWNPYGSPHMDLLTEPVFGFTNILTCFSVFIPLLPCWYSDDLLSFFCLIWDLFVILFADC
jgi:hypothetical protein